MFVYVKYICVIPESFSAKRSDTQETVKQLQEEMASIAEAQNTLRTFSDWLSMAAVDFRTVSESREAPDRSSVEKKMKRLEVCYQPCVSAGTLLLCLLYYDA